MMQLPLQIFRHRSVLTCTGPLHTSFIKGWLAVHYPLTKSTPVDAVVAKYCRLHFSRKQIWQLYFDLGRELKNRLFRPGVDQECLPMSRV